MRIVFITNRVKNYALGFQLVIDLLMELGHEVIWAADFTTFKGNKKVIPCEIYQTNFRSNPLNFNNIIAYHQLMRLFKSRNIDAIHCNTPIGGLIGRICAKKASIGTVIYTAHGFHFYRGAPLLNRTIFRWGEMYLARCTDVLITINNEDYAAAKSFKLRNNGKLGKIPGAGIITGFTSSSNITEKRKEIGVPLNAIMIFSSGELNKNKNHEAVIRALALLKNPNIYYVICGEGALRHKLERLARKLGLSEKVLFLGFRNDVLDILPAADIFAMTSFREGLPRSLMEAMDAGKPCIISKIRGNSDLILDGNGGFLRNPTDVIGFAQDLNKLINDSFLRYKFGLVNRKRVRDFDIRHVKAELHKIYNGILRNSLKEKEIKVYDDY